MNAFTWLLMGHLVGDWLLQSNWMAMGKKNGLVTLAGMVHFATYTAVTTGALWLSGVTENKPAFYLILSAIIIFVSHWLLDTTDIVKLWMHFYGQGRSKKFVQVMVDQTFHLLVLTLVTSFFLGR
jgi:hypothetical protein